MSDGDPEGFAKLFPDERQRRIIQFQAVSADAPNGAIVIIVALDNHGSFWVNVPGNPWKWHPGPQESDDWKLTIEELTTLHNIERAKQRGLVS